jgi:hypothetical protein
LKLYVVRAGLDAGLNIPDPITGDRFKLDIIGFDACLMAMYEVGSTLAPYGKYLLGSELLEPGHGWDYSALAGITQHVTAAGLPATSLAAQDVGDLFIDYYFAQVRCRHGLLHGSTCVGTQQMAGEGHCSWHLVTLVVVLLLYVNSVQVAARTLWRQLVQQLCAAARSSSSRR